ncbi:isoleucyl-tRNA synthetase [Delitschia confertaspora ATCC 74209]|uniref:Isoleucine--tRNA ligase, mitochondrial n=1 Tax=Delitschia confertaspora ATCC 74209 TaxID=1513339 RepID=A0A9P4JV74_9PLEO|nr:isoleucyl-tRNA synthetase [Delitschia confertaspora ATCC 74209]
MEDSTLQLVPGRSVGFMTLGCSLHEVLMTIKAEVKAFPRFQLYHDDSCPIDSPTHLTLPENGLRLRFDGPDQRLRLVEVLDFTKARLVYKDVEVFKAADGQAGIPSGAVGPKFRHIYDRLLGPTYGGEYLPPKLGDQNAYGTYNLSYPGIAFNFPVQHSAYSPKKDFISLLSSSATGPATSMAVFSGESWQKARGTLFTAPPLNPRALALAGKPKEGGTDEIELARIRGEGRIELVRRSSPPFWIILSETTPQDLIVELGAPDSIYRKNDHRLSIHKDRRASDASDLPALGLANNGSDDRLASDSGSQIGTDDEDDWEEDDEAATEIQEREVAAAEHFYNYYHHGFDLLISQPTPLSSASPTSPHQETDDHVDGDLSVQPLNHLTVTKVIFHGNVPGSYQFNRHRRSRWTLEHVPTDIDASALDSEMSFGEISNRLKQVFKPYYENPEEEKLQQRGMALNRGWGDSPGSSCELLGGWEDASGRKSKFANAESGVVDGDVGNVELFGFPGMVFEVLKNGAVSALTEVVVSQVPKFPPHNATMLTPTRILRASQWSSTIRIPKSTFPPRSTPNPAYFRRCTDDLYQWQKKRRTNGDEKGEIGEETFVLHDGPPYANGPLHIGHALNKITKDIICRYQMGQGKRVDYVPGWDCHGLPIELKALQAQGENTNGSARVKKDPVAIRKAARKLATKTIAEQMKGFKEWAVMGDWENPYKTMNKDFEIRQLEVFKKMHEKGLIHRQFKPVYWSPSSHTALAEAELEYDENHKSTAAFVRFEVTKPKNPASWWPEEVQDLEAVIWTTTPWTIPANRAIAIHNDMEYSMVHFPALASQYMGTKKPFLLVATSRMEHLESFLKGEEFTVIHSGIRGSDLAQAGLQYINPFTQNSHTVIHADFVSDSSGSGLVHLAPGHGMDDYNVCAQLGIEAFAPVDDEGRYTADAFPSKPGLLKGLAVSGEGKDAVIKFLWNKNGLLATHEITHKYPIDWRTKQPVIIRATKQWFASVDSIKDSVMRSLQHVKFIPESGRSRLESFVQGRSQWCISRQRAWGVPIPALYRVDGDEREAVMDSETIQHIIGVIQKNGIDSWWSDPEDDPKWIPSHLSGTYIRGKETMDVWFDSGTSWTLLHQRPSQPPADVYFEGTDQHRGWFQSSLLTHIATQPTSSDFTPKAPFSTLITHGFTLDAEGRKMSKSIGNVISPAEIMSGTLVAPQVVKNKNGKGPIKSQDTKLLKNSALGADALRLWVARSDYTKDVVISEPILKSVHSMLHKFRVTLRWLVGVLSLPTCPPPFTSFDALKSSVQLSGPSSELLADRIALFKLSEVSKDVQNNYAQYKFFHGSIALGNYVFHDLSAFYFETVKDRIYTGSVEECQTAQQVLGVVFYELLQMLAPVCPLLVEEVWDHLPEKLKEGSVHPARMVWKPFTVSPYENKEVMQRWTEDINKIFSAIKNAQERLRKEKHIGSGLESDVYICLPKTVDSGSESLFCIPGVEEQLTNNFVVSNVRVVERSQLERKLQEVKEARVPYAEEWYGERVDVVVVRAESHKCPRCWRFLAEQEGELCKRCEDVTKEVGL